MSDGDGAQSAQVFEGPLVVPNGARFALIVSRFNAFVVERLVDGALDALLRHGAQSQNIVVCRVPGAWELPVLAARLAATQRFDAIVALGTVIRGATPHFEYVASEATRGLAEVARQSGVPVALGVLTTDTIEQAVERAGSKAGNKGADAAVAAIEMVGLSRALGSAGY